MHHAITDRWADLTGLVWVLPSTSTFDLTCYEWAFRGRCSQRVLFSQPVKQNPPVGTKGPVNQTATWEAPQRGYCARVKTFILPATTTPTPPAPPECWHSNSQTPSHQSLLELCSNSNSLASFVNFFFYPWRLIFKRNTLNASRKSAPMFSLTSFRFHKDVASPNCRYWIINFWSV